MAHRGTAWKRLLAGAVLGIVALWVSAPTTGAQAVPEVALRVQVWDDTEGRPPARDAEVWFRQTGSWFPDLRHGSDAKLLEKRPVSARYRLFIYPDGRNGAEIEVPVRFTRDMCPSGCDRDALLVSIHDDHVEVTGVALVGEISQTFKREKP